MGVEELVVTGTSGSRRDQPMEFIDSRNDADAIGTWSGKYSRYFDPIWHTQEALDDEEAGRRTSRRTFALANAPSDCRAIRFRQYQRSMIFG